MKRYSSKGQLSNDLGDQELLDHMIQYKSVRSSNIPVIHIQSVNMPSDIHVAQHLTFSYCFLKLY